MIKKKVCVIGAGPSGLVTIKELLKENCEVTCYDNQEAIGGAFRSSRKGGRSYDSLQLTVSNYFMAFSDFIPKDNEERKYWTVIEYRNYLRQYAEHFNLYEHIHFCHKVIASSITNNKIAVTVATADTTFSKTFDHIIICSGSNFTPKTPAYLVNSDFTGQILHSSQYKNASDFIGKNVVCIGLGESGADIVHEISQKTNCTVIVRDYPNVVAKQINGYTNDAYTANCLYILRKKGIDRFMKLKAWYYLNCDKTLSNTDRLIQEWTYARKSFMSKFLTKSDIFIRDIVEGNTTLIKEEIQEITANSILTKSNKTIQADVIICNTGYKTSLQQYEFGSDFMNPRALFKHMIHPEHGSLISMIGWARPSQGGLPACSEMQARYIALIISGKKKLPEIITMNNSIKKDTQYYSSLFKESLHIKSLVSYPEFMKDMAALIGCTPKLIALHDLTLTRKMFFGSHLPAFYRISEPQLQEEVINLIKSLPTAYSTRRSLVLLMLTIIYSPSYKIKRFLGSKAA